MSIICGALKWLFDAEERKMADLKNEINTIDVKLKEENKTDDWLDAHHFQAKAKARKFELETMILKMKAMDERIQKVRESR